MANDYLGALVDQLDPSQRSKNTGINGGNIGSAIPMADQGQIGIAGPVGGAAPSPVTPVDTAAPSTAPKSDFSRVMGFDAGKFNDPNKHDFKYDTGRVLSQFDPRQGFTPEVINALNSQLGNTYGNFSGSGDKLSLTGAKGAKDAADFANQDWVYALKAGNDATKWNFGGGGAAPQEAGPAQGGGINPMLTNSDPTANINAALQQFGGQSDFLQQLLAKLQGGQAA